MQAGLALHSAAQQSVTVDEIFHVTGGYFYDTYGDYRIHPDNGVMPQRLHALPAWLGGARPPPLEGSEYWRLSDITVVAHQFFYESGNDHWPLLMRARALNLLFSLGLGLTVFVWARRLAGELAGFTALGLAMLSPTVLAHGPLATTDMAAAFLLTASAGLFWRQLSAGGIWRLAASAAAFSLACAAKYSAVLLLPVMLVLLGVHAATATVRPRLLRLAGNLAFHGLAAWFAIWMFFGFRYTAFSSDLPPADHFVRSWDWMLGRMGAQSPVIQFCRDLHLLPEAFLFGYTHTYVGSQVRGAFLAGEYSTTGWPQFFPLAFLWKSTPAELAGFALALLAAGLRWRALRPWLRRLAPLLALGAVYGAAALTSHLNIGHRHLLPLYPALFIVVGVAAARLAATTRARLGWAVLLAGAQAASCAAIHPYHLAYFNRAAGGPENGWRLLVDSSLDWGQDLARLRRWLDRNNADAAPVYLSYFGSGNIDYHGIKAAWMPFVNGFKFRHPWYEPRGGLYCVSATMLQQVYSRYQGPWTEAFERDYQGLRLLDPQFRRYWWEPSARAELLAGGAEEEWFAAWERYDLLRFARLCHVLRAREPDAMIGYSILVYRLTDAEVDAAVNGRYSDWLDAIEKAGREPSLLRGRAPQGSAGGQKGFNQPAGQQGHQHPHQRLRAEVPDAKPSQHPAFLHDSDDRVERQTIESVQPHHRGQQHRGPARHGTSGRARSGEPAAPPQPRQQKQGEDPPVGVADAAHKARRQQQRARQESEPLAPVRRVALGKSGRVAAPGQPAGGHPQPGQ